MDDQTKTALLGSIDKWKAVVAGTGADLGTINCSLCEKFYDDGECEGCPVMDRTRVPECRRSPHETWREHHETWREHQVWNHKNGNVKSVQPGCVECTQLAQDELDFLVSLLPVEEEC